MKIFSSKNHSPSISMTTSSISSPADSGIYSPASSSKSYSIFFNRNTLNERDISLAIDYSFSHKTIPKKSYSNFWHLTTAKFQQICKEKTKHDAPTPFSSRSVTFDDAFSWPFIDDEVDEDL